MKASRKIQFHLKRAAYFSSPAFGLHCLVTLAAAFFCCLLATSEPECLVKERRGSEEKRAEYSEDSSQSSVDLLGSDLTGGNSGSPAILPERLTLLPGASQSARAGFPKFKFLDLPFDIRSTWGTDSSPPSHILLS